MAKLRDKKIKSASSSDDIKLNNANNNDAKEHQSFVVDSKETKPESNKERLSFSTSKNSESDSKNILNENAQVLDATTLSKKGEEQKNSVESGLATSNEEKAVKTDSQEDREASLDEDYKKITQLMQNHSLSEKTTSSSLSSYETDDEGVDINVNITQPNDVKVKSEKVKKVKVSNRSQISYEKSDNKKAKAKKNAKPKKVVKKSFKQRMRTLGILIVLGVFTGSGLGVWYFNSVLRSNVNYGEYNVSDYIVSADEVLEEVYGISSNQENWLEIAKSSDKFNPSFLTPAQNFILAEFNATLADSFHAEGNGVVSTIATQSVYSEKNYDGNRYTFESISKGLMSIAICSAMDKGANSVELYTGSDIEPDDAVWGEPEIYSSDDYIELAGSTPDAIQPYIISDKTILSQTEVMYDEATGYYSFTMELDPVTSVLRYARQIRQTSGLSSYPEFDTVTQTITIDGDWNLVSIDVHETYSVVAFGIPASCTGTLLTYYEFNVDDVVLPV